MNELQRTNSFEFENPFKCFFHITGNSKIKNADIIFLTDFFSFPSEKYELNSSKWNRFRNIKLIDKIYSNQIILVEKCPYGQEIDVVEGIEKETARNQRFWDDEKFCEKIKELNHEYLNLYREKQVIEEDLEKKRYFLFFDKKNGDFIFETLNSLVKKNSILTKTAVLKIKSSFLAKQFKQFSFLMYELIDKIIMENRKSIRELYKKSFENKLLSLISKIKSEMELGNRMIVVLNGSLILKNRRLNDKEYKRDLFQEFIKDKKYVIISAKNTCLEIINDASLWGDDDFDEKNCQPILSTSPTNDSYKMHTVLYQGSYWQKDDFFVEGDL